MTVADAQREVRTVFLGGSVGSLVAAVLWALSGALATWVGARAAILAVVLGGTLIFPVTQLALRLSGRPWRLSRDNPLADLAKQVAFVIPATLPVVAAAALYDLEWFYPALAVVIGAHYLPFAFLYGMRHYVVLGTVLVGGGVAIALLVPESFTTGGWFVAAALAAFAPWAASAAHAPAPVAARP